MLDAPARRVLERPMSRLARLVDRPHVSPNRLTLLGLATGLGSAGAAAGQLWWWALGLWWFSRAMDGLDGPVARRRRAAAHGPTDKSHGSEAGGFLDITADFVVYGATVVGVAIGATAQYDATWLPFLLVLLAYYVNGTALLAFSSIAERTELSRMSRGGNRDHCRALVVARHPGSGCGDRRRMGGRRRRERRPADRGRIPGPVLNNGGTS